jgi:YVTN family beta-propeller protein
VGAACSTADERVGTEFASVAPAPVTTALATGAGAPPASTVPATTTTPPTTAAPPSTTTTAPPKPDLYAFTRPGMFAPQVAGIPHRVYVPNSDAGSLTVIDPATGTLVRTAKVGAMPHHVTPSWDLSVLYALDTAGNALYPIDPRTAEVGPAIPVEDPYNLYFTPDGTLALVIAERFQRIDARDPRTWELRFSVSIPHAGVNHGDFSADGRYFYASCEFSGWVVKVDLVERRVVAEVKAGAEPIDVKFSPDAAKLYVADQKRGGVMVLDPGDLHERAFIPTARGTHGLYPSRDATKLYATNRLAASVSVIDFATDQVVATWTIPGGGSPDMGSVSPDGTRFWVAGRYHAEVYAFDTATGELAHRIKAGAGAHGLSYFPQPGRYSLGHTGSLR